MIPLFLLIEIFRHCCCRERVEEGERGEDLAGGNTTPRADCWLRLQLAFASSEGNWHQGPNFSLGRRYCHLFFFLSNQYNSPINQLSNQYNFFLFQIIYKKRQEDIQKKKVTF